MGAMLTPPYFAASDAVTPAPGARLYQPHDLARALAAQATAALIDEANLTPKPGLVDQQDTGIHQDMDLSLLHDSARALQSGFMAMAYAALTLDQAADLRDELGRLGRLAEARMLQATGGVNTHRGAIWALGLLVAAAAQAPDTLAPKQVAQRAAKLAQLPDRYLPQAPASKGAQACQAYGVGGARAQACAGFPAVTQLALPQLQHSRDQGASEHHARLNALLAIITRLDDTCVLSRGGPTALATLQSSATGVLALGGTHTASGAQAYLQLCDTAQLLGVSPGGAADLLAATLLLDRLHPPHFQH